MLEKGKQPGSHLLSGAVVNPRPLRELFRGRLTIADMPTYGQVPGEAVYVLTRRSSFRIPRKRSLGRMSCAQCRKHSEARQTVGSGCVRSRMRIRMIGERPAGLTTPPRRAWTMMMVIVVFASVAVWGCGPRR